MLKAVTFELRVIQESGASFSYQNPSRTVCIQLSNCPNWKPAKKVSWRNLPAQWSVDFFQDDHCNGGANGDVYYWTGKTAEDGLHTFPTPRPIKSIYARPLWGSYPLNVARRCVQLRQPSKGAEATQLNNETSSGSCDEVNGTEWVTVGSDGEEGTSSNWLDPLKTKTKRRTQQVPRKSGSQLLMSS